MNGDNHAEAVVVGSYGSGPMSGHLRVYGAKNNDWVGTRRIWNQPSYHVTNISDDGSIPKNEAPSWLLNNNYRCNVPTSTPSASPYLAADISASYVRMDMSSYPGSVTVTMRVGNGGAKVVAAGLKVAFHDGDPANGGVLLGTVTTTKPLSPGEYEDVTFTWSKPADGSHSVFVTADPDSTVGECDTTNNTVSLQTFIASGAADPSIVAADVTVPATIPEGSLVNVVISVKNLGALPASNVPVRLYAGNPLSGGKQIGLNQAMSDIPAGGAASVVFAWDTLGAQGNTYLYAVVDPDGITSDANRGNNTAIREARVIPAEKPDLQIGVSDITVMPLAPNQGAPLTVNVNVHNRGLATGNVKVGLYNGNPATGGSLAGTTVIPGLIPMGGAATASVTVNTVDLSGLLTLVVKVDYENRIDESNETNNQASQAVTIAAAGVKVQLAAEKSRYAANEDARFTILLTNQKAEARGLTHDLRILDGKGNLTAQAAGGVPLTLGPNEVKALTVVWHTGDTVSGPYTAVIGINENGGTIAKDAASFTILPDLKVKAKVTTDKISYNPHEMVTLSVTATNLGVNTVLEGLTATVSIKDGQGSVLFVAAKPLATLMPGANSTYKGYWNTGTTPPGTYLILIEVKDPAGVILASGSDNLAISESGSPSKALKGRITVDRQSVLSGESLNVSFDVTNIGNVDLPDVALSVLTVHVANQTVIDMLPYQATLPMGASYANTGALNTTQYTAKDYMVIVRASINGVEETLCGTYFRIEGAPSAPTLAGPSGGADVATFTPTLSVSNASDPNDDRLSYEFEIYADSGLTSLVASGTTPETAGITAWTTTTLAENQTYFWRARAWDGRLYGPWMEPVSFRINTVNDLPTAPTISSPADGTAVDVLTPALIVNNSTDPDSANLTYNFEIALDPGFAQTLASTTGVDSGSGTTSWTVPITLQENQWYYWRVQADDWLDAGPWSEITRFQVNTANDAPSTPTVILPANGSTIASLSTDIVVNNGVDSDSTGLTYYFEVDTAQTFDSAGIIRSAGVAQGPGSTLWHLEGLQENTRYFVRVKANDGAADSPWSEVTSFFASAVNEPPTAPTLANPSNGAGVNVFTPALSVSNATDPDNDRLTYEFEVYADAAMTTLIARADAVVETIQTTSWTLPVPLAENQICYWRARASDGSLLSEWMPTASFMVNTANDAPGAPTLSSPADGSSVTTLTPTLAVNNAKDPDRDTLTYEFEIYNGSTLVASGSGVQENAAGITSWTSDVSLAGDTVYQWRSRAHDGDRYGPWIAMAGFTVHIPVTTISATINFDPDTLNKTSKGNWVTVSIELPSGYNPAEIDIASLLLEGAIPAEVRPCYVVDRDKDGIPDLMVKFRRSEVINLLSDGESVPVRVTGKVGAITFEGVDVIRVIH